MPNSISPLPGLSRPAHCLVTVSSRATHSGRMDGADGTLAKLSMPHASLVFNVQLSYFQNSPSVVRIDVSRHWRDEKRASGSVRPVRHTDIVKLLIVELVTVIK